MSNPYQNLTELGGLITDRPADKIPITSASDIANMDLSQRGLIQTRGGYEKFADDTTAVGVSLRGYLFIKNFGDNKRIKLRVIDNLTTSVLQWHNPSNPSTGDGKWEDLVTGLTTGKVMGFATANGNGGSNVNLVVFCNGVNNLSTWNGATALVSSVTSTSITADTIAFVDSNPDTITDSGNGFVTAGFVAGDKIVVSGTSNNNGTYTIDTVAAGTITLIASDALTAEGAGTDFTIVAGTIVKTGTSTFIQEGFTASGNIIIDGTSYAYDSNSTITDTTIAFVNSNPDTITDSNNGFLTAGFKAGDVIYASGSADNTGYFTIDTVTAGTITLIASDSVSTFTAGSAITITSTRLIGVTPDPTTQNPDANSGIAQKADTTTHSGLTKGNILLTTQRKLWIAGEVDYENRVNYSETGDVTDFSSGSGLDSYGSFTLLDAPGGITLLDAFGKDGLIIHKENALVKYIRGNDGTNVIEQFDTLSQNADVGASNLKAGAGLNQIAYYMTKTEGLKSLQKAIQDDSLNLESITDVIAPTIEDYDFSSAASVYFPPKKVLLIACKSSSDVSVNDKVIAYYIRRGEGGSFSGDFSIDNLFVADWIVDGTKLYFVSSIDQNSYKMYGQNSDNGSGVNHSWTSKEFTFGEPARGKEFNTLYVEGFIKEATKIKATVLYGNLGSKGTKSKVIEWDADYVSDTKVKALGDDVLGSNSIGASSADIQDSYAFEVPIHFDVNKATRYKIKFETEYDSETTDESFWAISNLSTNPGLKTVDGNTIINSNS